MATYDNETLAARVRTLEAQVKALMAFASYMTQKDTTPMVEYRVTLSKLHNAMHAAGDTAGV